MAAPILCYTHDVLGVKHLLRQLGATPVSCTIPIMMKCKRGGDRGSLQYRAGRETIGMEIVSKTQSTTMEV